MRTTWMRGVSVIGIALVLLGCDFLIPISTEPAGQADESVVGLWRRTDQNGGQEDLLILKWDDGHWLISLPAGREDALYARAWPVRVGERTLAQLDWIGSGKGVPVQGPRRYQLAVWSLEGERLVVRRVAPEAVGGHWRETHQLRNAVERVLDRPGTLIDERVYLRVRSEP